MSGILQVCITCRNTPKDPEIDSDVTDGKQLFEALDARVKQSPDLALKLTVQPVECMNVCQSSCSVALRSLDKFNFVIGALDTSDERVEDILNFSKRYLEAENGLPAWRERPVHVRKNTLARLHPINPTSAE